MQPDSPIVTVQQHVLEEQSRFQGSPGEFSWLLSGFTLAAKMIQAKVRRAGLTTILGAHGAVNVQGETQQKLDVFANEALMHCLGLRESIGVIASEENEHPVVIRHESPDARYAVVFDPLDGSSNIDVAVSVGTIFSIFERPADCAAGDREKWLLQPGKKQVAAGYVVYGSSTLLVYSVGNGVHGFTLDPEVGAFVLSHPNIRMPERGSYYSVNEANAGKFPEAYRRYLAWLRERKYSSRYVGSMVADFHRTLLTGGVFLYPPTEEYPSGKLRLLYEANPIAFLAKEAGGEASDGAGPILEVRAEKIHQRTPLVVGSRFEMEEFAGHGPRPRD